MPSSRAITIRLPEELLAGSRRIAHRRRQSVNALVRHCLEGVLREEKERDLSEAFRVLGENAQEADVEFAFEAQAEVVNNG